MWAEQAVFCAALSQKLWFGQRHSIIVYKQRLICSMEELRVKWNSAEFLLAWKKQGRSQGIEHLKQQQQEKNLDKGISKRTQEHVGIHRTEMMLASSPQHLQGNAKDKNMDMWGFTEQRWCWQAHHNIFREMQKTRCHGDSQQRCCWQAPQVDPQQGSAKERHISFLGKNKETTLRRNNNPLKLYLSFQCDRKKPLRLISSPAQERTISAREVLGGVLF